MRQTLCIIMLFALLAPTLSMLPPRIIGMDRCVTAESVPEDFETNMDLDAEPLLRNPKTRCYAACVLEENKTLNSDGTLNVQRIIETIPDDIVNRDNVIAAYKSCANEAGIDDCERAYKTVVCINNNDVISNKRVFE